MDFSPPDKRRRYFEEEEAQIDAEQRKLDQRRQKLEDERKARWFPPQFIFTCTNRCCGKQSQTPEALTACKCRACKKWIWADEYPDLEREIRKWRAEVLSRQQVTAADVAQQQAAEAQAAVQLQRQLQQQAAAQQRQMQNEEAQLLLLLQRQPEAPQRPAFIDLTLV